MANYGKFKTWVVIIFSVPAPNKFIITTIIYNFYTNFNKLETESFNL